MMNLKKKTFDIPFIGYDYGQDNNWSFDVLIGQYGNPIIGIQIKNIVEQYSADPYSYEHFHTILNQVIAIIGENHVVQKIDIFSKQKYVAEKEKEFLQQKFSEHFNGRVYKTIDTIFLFSELVDHTKKKKEYSYSEKRYKNLRDKCLKIFMLLDQNKCEPKFLKEKDFDYYMSGILSMNFSAIPKLNNIKSNNDYLQVGNQYVKTISFVDIEKIELPSQIETYSTLGGNGTASDTAVDNFSFINELVEYKTIVYNQIISIPHQSSKHRELEKKKKKHEGVANNSPSNAIVANEIEELLHNVALDGQMIVDAHYSLCYSTDSLEQMEETQSLIENKLFMKGIIVSQNSYNQLELFRCCLPGNAVELKDYDLFTTTSEAALCFFFKESYPVNEDSNFYLRFTDRQGVPIKVDPADLPMKTGRINNRNKFVLGPSGSGKSFLMNNIIEQYLTYNYDVVIVDVGDSYSGLCAYKGGRYIQYTEEKPITMNPFVMIKEELTIEKIEFLANLIFLIWQGADATIEKGEKSILDNVLISYYDLYFNKGEKWYEDKDNDTLLLYLEKFNINQDDIYNETIRSQSEFNTYYDVLGIPFNSTAEDLKIQGRKLLMTHHPDHNIENKTYNPELYFQIYEAYEVLTDDVKRKEYNETKLMQISKNEIIRKVNINEKEGFDENFRTALIRRIEIIEETMSPTELSFNGFYEYCESFLPIYLNNKKYPVTDQEFNQRGFFRILRDFYKGGRYGTTLNESADKTLFNEPFIVFEIDNVKDNPTLFPIVTLIIMDTFIQKMRLRKDRRKAIIIEEAWKAIASKLMGGYILYLYKTVRKFWGEAIVVTQELGDIIGNTVIKDSIINNSDTFILLDQTKFKDNFEEISALLSLNKVEQNKIFTINNLDNKYERSYFKEFYLKRGSKGEVYGNEVSLEQYLTYTTEKPEKVAIEYYVNESKNYDDALRIFINDFKNLNDKMENMVALINLYQKPLDKKAVNYYQQTRNINQDQNVLKIIGEQMKDRNLNFSELINSKTHEYEKV